MCTEYVRVAQQLYILKRLRVPSRNVLAVKTDCVVYQASPRIRTGLTDVSCTNFHDLHTLRARYEPLAAGLPVMRRLNELAPVSPILACGPVFRSGPGTPMLGDPPLPVLTGSALLTLPQWHDVSQEAAMSLALAGEGLFIRGIAGSGKTFFARRIIDAMRAEGRNVVVLAKTHVATKKRGWGLHAESLRDEVRRAGCLSCGRPGRG